MQDFPNSTDRIYSDPRPRIGNFAFDEAVAGVFDDMIRRSVPGYAMTLSMLGLIAARYAAPRSRIYDLGCSLGAGIVAMDAGLGERPLNFVGVDNAQPMLDRCRKNTASLPPYRPVQLICADLIDTTIENASIVALNFTLQFIPLNRRSELLARIAQSLRPGGVLILSEKIRFEDPATQSDLEILHHDFKRTQGYSDLEISQKRSALEKVLMPESIADHSQRLAEAGFARSEVWLQCFNFASILAFK